ncbi:MAG: transcription elongation factor GreA [Coriobacteriales bacterium]|jgi:transcription elongation factor GreA|nr:transcription elongation factor GreA [Coriobacteriales bacterium]
MPKDNMLTPEGRKELEQELHELETVKRAEIGERIKIAREFGDISENSEYDDAKNEQAWMEGRILEITQILANATIVELPKRSNRVSIGNVVTVTQPDGSERVFTIVGAAEADISRGRISNESPVGAALLGARKGDTIEVDSPSGKKLAFTIVKIGK